MAVLLCVVCALPTPVGAVLETDGATFMQVDFGSPKSTPGYTTVGIVRIHTNGTRETVKGSSTNALTSKQQVRTLDWF